MVDDTPVIPAFKIPDHDQSGKKKSKRKDERKDSSRKRDRSKEKKKDKKKRDDRSKSKKKDKKERRSKLDPVPERPIQENEPRPSENTSPRDIDLQFNKLRKQEPQMSA